MRGSRFKRRNGYRCSNCRIPLLLLRATLAVLFLLSLCMRESKRFNIAIDLTL